MIRRICIPCFDICVPKNHALKKSRSITSFKTTLTSEPKPYNLFETNTLEASLSLRSKILKMKNRDKLKVEVWSDIVCPFCYIGKRNYENALAQFANAEDVELEFKSFQLDPNFKQNPNERLDLTQNLAKKYGKSIQEVQQMQAGITQTAKSVGLDFDFDKAITFNTFDAHRVAQVAKEKGIGNELEEAFFAAYFVEGKDLGNPEVLKQTAINVGLTAEDIDKALTDSKYADQVKSEINEAAQLGISGVPFFVFDRKYGVSGAQPVEVFLQTLEAAHKEWKEAQKPIFKNVAEGPACDASGNCS